MTSEATTAILPLPRGTEAEIDFVVIGAGNAELADELAATTVRWFDGDGKTLLARAKDWLRSRLTPGGSLVLGFRVNAPSRKSVTDLDSMSTEVRLEYDGLVADIERLTGEIETAGKRLKAIEKAHQKMVPNPDAVPALVDTLK